MPNKRYRTSLPPNMLSEAELDASLEHALREWNGRDDAWLFAYGSLIWHPQIQFEDRLVGTVHGYHRRLCLWSRINRGTIPQPGLVLALDRGGSCRGVAYRIAAQRVHDELRRIWQREMVFGSYAPTWLRFRAASAPLKVLGFVIDPASSGYTGDLPEHIVLDAVASGIGRYGTCVDYILRTVDGLRDHGIHDRQLLRLRNLLVERTGRS